MDKNLFELIVYIFSLFGDYDYSTSDDHVFCSSEKGEIIHYNVAFYNSPLYKSFDCELTSDMKFTEAAEKILESFNNRFKENKMDKQKLNSMYGLHMTETDNFLSGAILGYCQTHTPEEVAELFNATFNVIPKDKGINIAACISGKGILTYGLKEVE